MKKETIWIILSSLIAMTLLATSCSVVQVDPIAENESTVKIEIMAVGPVIHTEFDQYELIIRPDVDENIRFLAKVTPVNPPDGKSFSVALQVSSKKGVVFDENDTVILLWSADEMTKPIPPSPDERDSRIIEQYQRKLSSWPPYKQVVLKVPAFDKGTASIIKELNDSLLYMRKAQWPMSPTVDNIPEKYNLIPISGMQITFDHYLTLKITISE